MADGREREAMQPGHGGLQVGDVEPFAKVDADVGVFVPSVTRSEQRREHKDALLERTPRVYARLSLARGTVPENGADLPRGTRWFMSEGARAHN